jgi:hypothetical protein
MRAAAQIAIPVLLPRGLILWGIIRLVFAAMPLAAGQAPGSFAPSPIGIVLLCGIVGLIDVGARGERALWANLGLPRVAVCVLYAGPAIPGEVLLVLLALPALPAR